MEQKEARDSVPSQWNGRVSTSNQQTNSQEFCIFCSFVRRSTFLAFAFRKTFQLVCWVEWMRKHTTAISKLSRFGLLISRLRNKFNIYDYMEFIIKRQRMHKLRHCFLSSLLVCALLAMWLCVCVCDGENERNERNIKMSAWNTR